MRVEEHTITLAGAPVFYRARGGPGVPTLYLHGAPTSSDDWTQVLEHTGGIAPDLPGFGRSAKGAHLVYTPEALADFVEDLLSTLGLDRVKLVCHGWGTATGVLLAARQPERIERLVLFNSVPLLEGLEWPWWARVYRMRGVGELAMGATTRGLLRRWLLTGSVRTDDLPSLARRCQPRLRRWPRRRSAGSDPRPDRVATIWRALDQGTQRAILRLMRSVDDERQQHMASALESLRMPVLVIWGERDPWWDKDVLDAYASRLAQAQIERVRDAGHWPWLDSPTAVELLTNFLDD